MTQEQKDLERIESFIVDLDCRGREGLNQKKSFFHYRAFLKASLEPNSKLAQLQKKKEELKNSVSINPEDCMIAFELQSLRKQIEDRENHRDILG